MPIESRNAWQGDSRRSRTAAPLGFEQQLWLTADKLRNNMDAAEYKHVVLGLIFLKYISDAFEEKHAELEAQKAAGRRPRRPGRVPRGERLLGADGGPLAAPARPTRSSRPSASSSTTRWCHRARQPALKGVLPKDYARPASTSSGSGEIDRPDRHHRPGRRRRTARRTSLGRVYEYFLAQFASAEGKKGGQFYTPRASSACWSRCSRRTRAASTTPAAARAGCSCRARSSSKRTAAGSATSAIYGQESNHTTWRLAKMNLAIRGIDATSDRARRHLPPRPAQGPQGRLRARQPAVQRQRLGRRAAADDVRWKYGVPPAGNANFAWVQHFIHHLAPTGIAGFVLANGSMSSNQSGEGEIRKAIIEADLVDCMVALPGQLFYTTQIPVCLWFLARNKKNGALPRPARRDALHRRPQAGHAGRPRPPRADRRGHRQDRRHLPRLARRCRAAGEYEDVPGFCKAATLDEIRKHGHVLTPGRYVGAEEVEDDGEPFEEKMQRLAATLREQQAEAAKLDAAIAANLKELGYGG